MIGKGLMIVALALSVAEGCGRPGRDLGGDGKWTKLRIPFVVWDADSSLPRTGNAYGFDPENDHVTEVQIRRENDQQRISVTTMAQPAQAHMSATATLARMLGEHDQGHIGHWLDRYADRLPTLDDPKWRPAPVEFGSTAVTGKRITWDAFTFAVAEHGAGTVIVGCMGAGLPRLVPATLGIVISALPVSEPDQRSVVAVEGRRYG